jgi:hypothetical protein
MRLSGRHWLLNPDPHRAVVLSLPPKAVLQRRRAGPLQIILPREDAREIFEQLHEEFNECSDPSES